MRGCWRHRGIISASIRGTAMSCGYRVMHDCKPPEAAAKDY